MSQRRTREASGLASQGDLALKLRMAAPFFDREEKSYDRLIYRQRAKKARAELAETQQKSTEQTLKMLIRQLSRLLMALSPKPSDTRTVDAQIRISRCLSQLYALAAEMQIELSRSDGEQRTQNRISAD